LAERLRIALCCSGWELMARCSFGGHAGLQGKGKRGANACGKYSAKAMPGAGKVVERGKGTSENRSEPWIVCMDGHRKMDCWQEGLAVG